MSKIQNADEFKCIIESGLGFIVTSDNAANTLHQSKCTSLTNEAFSNLDENSLHWFSTIDIAEKLFIVTPCKSCNPE